MSHPAVSKDPLACVGPALVSREHTRSLRVALGITLSVLVAEAVGGVVSNSLALLADAGHMLTDSAAVGLALFASWIARRPATQEKTFGYLRVEVLAALVNGAVLLVVAGVIVWHAIERFATPPVIQPHVMVAVAAVGFAANAVAVRMLHRGHEESLNLQAAYLHVLGDLLGSVGALFAGAIILTAGWTLADPIVSVFIAILILIGALRLVRESVDVLLEAVPRHISLEDVGARMLAIDGVSAVHDLHVWTVTSGLVAMSGHAVVPDPASNTEVLAEIRGILADMGIHHVTVQIENDPTGCVEDTA